MTAAFKRKKLNIIVTAGPTREPIDPVRYISNYSTGTMGYAIAAQAKKRNHNVVLISGPCAIQKPKGVKVVDIETASELKNTINKFYNWADCVIMASAVSDFKIKRQAKSKIKTKKHLCLQLIKNSDILKELGKNKKGKILVGFALESENLLKNALWKLEEKNLDMVVANKVGKNMPFGAGKTTILIIDRLGNTDKLSNIDKRKAAFILLDKIQGLC